MSSETETVDFLIIGSGAAAMAAAIRAHDLGLRVLLVEKSDRYGGSTAMSGGVCWVPNNPGMHKKGVEDSDQDALDYLTHITKGEVEPERLQTYIRESQRVLSYLEAETHVRYDAMEKYTDYYPEAPGGRLGGRSMDAVPFDGTKLGSELRRLRLPHPQSQIMGKFGITAAAAQKLLVNNFSMKLFMLGSFVGWGLRFLKRGKYGRDTRLTCGNSLMGRLRRSLMDRGIPLWLESPAVALTEDAGRITGAVLQRGDEQRRALAEHGVLLAAGGFARNAAMRNKWQRHPITTKWTAANLHNEGDGIQMGIDAGGAVKLMKEAWWTPTTLVPGSDLAWVLVVEKNLPGSIFVNAAGARFCNEAAPYVDVVVDMYEADSAQPCWMVFDARFRHYYPVGPVAPGYAMPDSRTPRRYREGFLRRADSIRAVAELIDVDPQALEATIARFNQMAKAGKDDDFARGESASDRYYGDPRVKPNPCLFPIEKAPFYAIPVYPGDLGTKGGLVTDLSGRVLTEHGAPIPGLFAAGNCAASVMGRTYPGAGGTIGPALTFGFLAAEAAAQSADHGKNIAAA
jgi:3-oxosteroid 1-dehydrogenase